MCGIVLLIALIVYACRIPGLRRSTPADFPGCDAALHAQWQAKALRTTYIFVGGVGALTVLTIGATLATVAIYSRDQAAKDTAAGIVMAVSSVATLTVLIWAMVIERQASKLKKAMTDTANLPPTYYPRPGQRLVEAPPVATPSQQLNASEEALGSNE